MLAPFLEAFEAKFKKTDGCWIWNASHNGPTDRHPRLLPYGTIRYKGKTAKAHRVAYEIYTGAIPKGQIVMHLCDNSLCVNPSHLRLGTLKENIVDCVLKGRHVVIPHYGEDNPMSKLTWEKVRGIRAMHKTGVTQKFISTHFKMSPMAISRAVRNLSWKEKCV